MAAVMMVGIDESEHSMYALEWTLDRFFLSDENENPPFKLHILHARPHAISALCVSGPGAAQALPFVDSDLKKMSARTVEKAKHICSTKSVKDVTFEVAEGDPRQVLCDAVDKHAASILVIGSHGYGAIKRAVLGSVSDYCSHHAHCTVMIVKKPKTQITN
ncbi:unnamed protein product [Microthlaspi erraticum]|uniref:UspA domain-containing protein n=1 Tax=Microthlaspi erraticum TaxID=1685480 RepID=A0A6D2JWP1_9BRAS|nr:unnamed protein product [Microthlaspi erraticum]